jgi:spore coat polysaccharide biosynthesis protein SpsF
VTPFIWRRPDEFRLALLEAPEDWGDERWTVDHPSDLEFVRAVFARLPDPDDFGVRDVLEILDREPALRAINASERAASEPVR